MAISDEYRAYVQDLFGDLGPIAIRRMFGGGGVYLDDAMFALIVNDTLYMKADPDLAERYAAEGSAPFEYARKTGMRTIPGLMSLPDSALDDPDEAVQWARLSLVPAEQAAADKRAAKARKAARKAAANG